ncbi:hypothetical protein HPB48_013811 [Haemaphysalis longicornis]|uniref:Sodium-dependent multivitamin transporter n=1 Tax=Haemaphysalis longicornis TaxID=44386 RepID=A0A9J6FCS5_HAELO|nr:hypothetical protein HPB48_013811 [Haemaphysalis longicornis]
MAAPPLHVSDYIVLGLLSALGIAAGLYISFSRRRNRHGVAPVPSDGARDVEQEEAFLGSRRLYAIPLSVSLFASALTSTSLVSFPAHYYAYGMHAIWCLVSIAVVTPIVAHTFVPVLYNLHLTSVFEVSTFVQLVLSLLRPLAQRSAFVFNFLGESTFALSPWFSRI